MKKMLLTGVCASALLAATGAFAADLGIVEELAPVPEAPMVHNSWYVSLFGGWSAPRTEESDFTYFFNGVTAYAYSATTELNSGYIVGLAAGRNLFGSTRGEVEFAFSSYNPGNRKEVSLATASAASSTFYYTPAGGSLTSFTVMANIWHDFENSSRITPYVGGGLGVGYIQSSLMFDGIVGTSAYNDTALAAAFQIGAGVNFALHENVSLGVGYRFRGFTDFSLQENGGVHWTSTDLGWNNMSHNILANINFNFGGGY